MGYGDLLFLNKRGVTAPNPGVNRAAAPTPAPAPAPAPTTASWTPAGGGQYVGGGPTNVPGGNAQVATQPYQPGPTAPPPPPGPGPGGPSQSDIQKMIDDALAKQREEYETRMAAEKQARDQEASAFLRDMLDQYGMGDLADSVDSLIREWGNSSAVISNKLKQTESYKQRFKGLLQLQQRGINDVRNEGEYLRLESQYRQAFREANLQNYIGAAGSTAERDAIARLVGDFNVSVDEVKNRISDAQRVVAETPQEVRDSLQRYYNVDPSTLTAYVLDPTKTQERINRLANAAIVGGYGQRAGLEFGATAAERIGEFIGRGGDLRGSELEPVLTGISETQKATERLAQLEGSTLSAEETALGQLDLELAAKEKVKGLQSRERARFGGSGAVTTGTLSRNQGV